MSHDPLSAPIVPQSWGKNKREIGGHPQTLGRDESLHSLSTSSPVPLWQRGIQGGFSGTPLILRRVYDQTPGKRASPLRTPSMGGSQAERRSANTTEIAASPPAPRKDRLGQSGGQGLQRGFSGTLFIRREPTEADAWRQWTPVDDARQNRYERNEAVA